MPVPYNFGVKNVAFSQYLEEGSK